MTSADILLASSLLVEREVKRVLRVSRTAAVIVTSWVDPSELMVLALERSSCGGLLGGSGSWKMGASPKLRGVGVGALLELPEVSQEPG